MCIFTARMSRREGGSSGEMGGTGESGGVVAIVLPTADKDNLALWM